MKGKLRSNLTTILLIFFVITATWQTDIRGNGRIGNWRHYTSKAEVTSMVDDGEFLWVGTYGGLTRLNKNSGSMIHFHAANSGLPDNMIICIAKDVDGDLWIGTDSGLANFDGASWVVYKSHNSPIPRNEINCIAVDSRGNKWIGVFMAGLFRFDDHNWTVFDTSNSPLPSDDFRSIAIDSDDVKYIGTNGSGLARFDGSDWTIYNTSNSDIPGDMISSLAFDVDGSLWVGTSHHGLARFDGESWKVYNTDNSALPRNSIRCIVVAQGGDKWIGTYGGLVKYNNVEWTWTLYETDHLGLEATDCLELPDRDVWSVLVDEEGVKWLGFYGGLVRFDGTSWTKYDTGNSRLPDNYVTSLALGPEGLKWIGTWGGGLVKFDGANWTVYTEMTSDLPSNNVQVFGVDGDGGTWLWSWNYGQQRGGLTRFNGSNWVVFNQDNSGFPDSWVTDLKIDTNNNKWILAYDWAAGAPLLVKSDNERWVVYDVCESGLEAYSSLCLDVDAEGAVWVGAPSGWIDGQFVGGGVARFDGSTWTVFTTSNSGLPSNWVTDLASDLHGNIWVATYPEWDGTNELGGGLARFDGLTWEVFMKDNSPLPSNIVDEIMVSEDGAIWGFTSGQTQMFRLRDSNWSVVDLSGLGLPNRRIESLAQDADGSLWFATWGGLGVLESMYGDLDHDWNVDFLDIAVLGSAWRTQTGYEAWNPLCDMAAPHDGVIDADDLSVLAANWLEGSATAPPVAPPAE